MLRPKGPRGHLCCDPTHRGSSSSSSLSSCLDDRCEFYELTRAVDEASQRYSETTHEVGWLERCLDAIRVAFMASERETTTV